MPDAHENNPETVWKIVKKVGVAMLVTQKDSEFEGRPLQAFAEPEAGRILFMTDSQHVIDEVTADPRVLLSFANTGGNDFAAIDGTATVSNDRAKIRDLWTPWAEAFWESPEDPAIRIIDVTPHRARYWDAPNRVATMIAMLAGAVTGKAPSLGKSGDVQLT
jgi:general stress protein 26